jgi:SAM-dependent methyltransferase
MNAGLQPYDEKDFDAKDKRNTIDIFCREILPIVLCEQSSFCRALDVGCGNGRFSNILAQGFGSVVCIDQFRQPSHEPWENVFFQKVPFLEFETLEKFDLIMFFGVFYMMDHEKCIKKCLGILEDGGSIAIIDEVFRNAKNGESGTYDLDLICSKFALSLKDCIQDNGVHRVSILKRKK